MSKKANVAEELKVQAPAAQVVAEAKKPTTPAKTFADKLKALALEATVKDGHEIREKVTPEQLLEMSRVNAPRFELIGKNDEEGRKSSAELYAAYARVFPIHLSITGKADINTFMQSVYASLEDQYKTPATGKPGFMSCQSAAKERNHVAIGIVSMGRWVSNNKGELLKHLGIRGLDDDTKALKAAEKGLAAATPFLRPITRKFVEVDDNGEPVAEAKTIVDIMTALFAEFVAPKLKAMDVELDTYKREMKAKLEKEAAEAEKA